MSLDRGRVAHKAKDGCCHQREEWRGHYWEAMNTGQPENGNAPLSLGLAVRVQFMTPPLLVLGSTSAGLSSPLLPGSTKHPCSRFCLCSDSTLMVSPRYCHVLVLVSPLLNILFGYPFFRGFGWISYWRLNTGHFKSFPVSVTCSQCWRSQIWVVSGADWRAGA